MPRAQKQKMPKCQYGVACTRRDCVYTHPPRPAAAAKKKPVKVEVAKSGKACVAFLSGFCTFGGLCRDEHPTDPDEVARLIEGFQCRPCRFGAACQTAGCLYNHPEPLPVPGGEGDYFTTSMTAHASPPAPPPPPPTHEESLTAFFLRVGEPSMVKKVPAMLARFEGNEEALFASLEAKHGAAVVVEEMIGEDLHESRAASEALSRLDLGVDFRAQQAPPPPPPLPKPQVWPKAVGRAPTSDLRAQTGSFGGGGGGRGGGQQLLPKTVAIPAHLWTLDVVRDASAFSVFSDPLERFAAVNGSLHSSASGGGGSGSSGGGGGGSGSGVGVIGSSLKAAGNGGISVGSSSSTTRPLGVLDLHFQSTRTFPVVLEALLDHELAAVKDAMGSQPQGGSDWGGGGGGGEQGQQQQPRPVVWVVTGTGHHTGQSHVKAGSLYAGVEAYLAERGYEYARGKDGAGRSGAFAVYPWF